MAAVNRFLRNSGKEIQRSGLQTCLAEGFDCFGCVTLNQCGVRAGRSSSSYMAVISRTFR